MSTSGSINWEVTSSSTAGGPQEFRSSDSSDRRPQWRAAAAIQEDDEEARHSGRDFHSTGSLPEDFCSDVFVDEKEDGQALSSGSVSKWSHYWL